MQNGSPLKRSVALALVVLFVGTSTVAMGEFSNAIFTKTKITRGFHESSRDQIELKYYVPDSLSWAIGIQGGTPPYVWKSAIRFTQTELACYSDWTLTQVVIGFAEDPNEGLE